MKGLGLSLLLLWIPGSQAHSGFQVVRAAFGGAVTITCSHHDDAELQNYVKSWCRQINEEACENVVETNGFNRGNEGRTSMTSSYERKGTTTITITELQAWDSGLYCWRIWTGYAYEVREKILLLVLEGLDSQTGPEVAFAAPGGSVTLQCLYSQTQRWAKVWCKQRSEGHCDWLFHSNGKTIKQYMQRAAASDEQRKGRMSLTLRDLRLWDTGLYKCENSHQNIILKRILLLISEERAPAPGAITIPGKPAPTFHSAKYLLNAESPKVYNQTQIDPTPSSYTKTQYPAWDILRWILLLILIICLLLVNCYVKTKHFHADRKM
ncbi:polymeric immunoglobulin receptor-like [Rhinatrema bivittatum]|uniref:polymeric immunoglobulin receptor-like n=1 Tax=Rhinatrema bivittatum TaxID=194408 RepID=UPI00112A5FC1|nr:polymeric immunoglobulin receptor-like [Rhinatrema bivittatum]